MRGKRANPPVLKRFGQHFLTDQSALRAIADAVAPEAGEMVVEIGPGRGALTDMLAARGNPLIAIEIDRALATSLRERYASMDHVTIVEDDVLRVDLSAIAGARFVVAGNVPYYITTPILFHVLRQPFPRSAVFLVQKEVADRMVSPAGSKTYGALSVNVQAVARVEIVREVPRGSFSPPPKVDSAVVRVVPRSDPLVALAEIERFRGFVQGLFGMRRKQIGNSLRGVAGLSAEESVSVLESAGIEPSRRVETMSPEEIIRLMRGLSRQAPSTCPGSSARR